MNSKPAVEVKSDMYTHKSFDLVNYVLGDVPVEAVDLPEAAGPAAVEPSTSELVLPARRPTAVAMISNKRKLSARITDRFSPYMLNHLHQVRHFESI